MSPATPAEHGEGEPLLLLHGGLGSGEIVGPVLPGLAGHRRVVAADLQAHGRTADIGRRDGWYPEVLAGFDGMGARLAEFMKPSPVYQAYARAASRPEDWPLLLDKVGDLLRRDYDWTADVGAVTAPVMVVYADADSVRPEHVVECYRLLGGGWRDAHWDGSLRPAARLVVLPGHIHTDVLAAPALAPAVTLFLDAAELVPPSLEAAPPG